MNPAGVWITLCCCCVGCIPALAIGETSVLGVCDCDGVLTGRGCVGLVTLLRYCSGVSPGLALAAARSLNAASFSLPEPLLPDEDDELPPPLLTFVSYLIPPAVL